MRKPAPAYHLHALRRIARSYGVRVESVRGRELRGRGLAVGREDICLGRFDDLEVRGVAFFHELGHCTSVLPPYSTWKYDHYHEVVAWKRGLELAQAHGYQFSEKVLDWARKQLTSYFDTAESVQVGDHDASPDCFLEEALIEASLPTCAT